jgi:dUTP pyrophosphatase
VFELPTIFPAVIHIKYFTDIDHIGFIPGGDWVDLRSAEDIILTEGEFHLIPLGIAVELPQDYEAHVVPRSSTFKTWGILQTNSMGVIDNSYSGDLDEWKMPVYATRDTFIEKNSRVCQFRIVHRQPNLEFHEVATLGNPNRSGFGSTGVI